MLSAKVRQHLEALGVYDPSDDDAYRGVLEQLGIPLDTAFADFHLHTTAVTFVGRLYELYNVCWFSLNATYEVEMEAAWRNLKLPNEYIPLDSFEAGGGFFYNRATGQVLELELGEKLRRFLANELQPQWNTFNEFLEWYFEL